MAAPGPACCFAIERIVVIGMIANTGLESTGRFGNTAAARSAGHFAPETHAAEIWALMLDSPGRALTQPRR